MDNEEQANGHEMAQKRSRYGPNILSTTPIQINESGPDSVFDNGVSANVHLSDSDLTPAEQMIAMIGALLAEGERGAESLELLISNIHPDLLADIVITNMKHLPKSSPPLTRLGSLPVTVQNCSSSSPAQAVAPSASVSSAQGPIPVVTAGNLSLSDAPIVNNFPVDSKRDPRRVCSLPYNYFFACSGMLSLSHLLLVILNYPLFSNNLPVAFSGSTPPGSTSYCYISWSTIRCRCG